MVLLDLISCERAHVLTRLELCHTEAEAPSLPHCSHTVHQRVCDASASASNINQSAADRRPQSSACVHAKLILSAPACFTLRDGCCSQSAGVTLRSRHLHKISSVIPNSN